MNVLVIGGGGREHAICYALNKSASISELYCNPGNPGIGKIANNTNFDFNNEDELISFCNSNKIELVVVGPEQPLTDGIADILMSNDIKCFGPSKFASQLEGSKSFAKNFMKKYKIPTAEFNSFTKDEIEGCYEYLNNHSFPVVIKADGLAGGKGVLISNDLEEAKDLTQQIFSGRFGIAGERIVIEEFMHGEEASVFAICDGNDYICLSPSQDHKRALDGDYGLNTGGMGAYAPTPFLDESLLDIVKRNIIEPVIEGMKKEGDKFIGCLYCGLMIDNQQVKVVEFNVRFGDPETQSVLPLLEGDFGNLLYSASCGKIDKTQVKILDKCIVTVILASQGYPENYSKGYEISGLEGLEKFDNLIVFHSGTKLENNKLLTNGGRVLAVCGIADNLQKARDIAYNGVDNLYFKNMYYRKDIAYKALK